MSLSPELALALGARLRRGETVVICGQVGSGKTTLLRELDRLSRAPEERVIVVEECQELNLPDSTSLCADSRLGIDLGDLIRYSQRMRPHRLVVGELRGDAAYQALTAWNSGLGGLANIHAASIAEAKRRLIAQAQEAGSLSELLLEDLVERAIDVFLLVKRGQVVDAWWRDASGRLAPAFDAGAKAVPEPGHEAKEERDSELGL